MQILGIQVANRVVTTIDLTTIGPHLIDFMFHGSGGPIFAVCKKKKKSGRAPAHMCTSTNLRRRDARKKINDIHGDFFYPPPGSQFSLGNP